MIKHALAVILLGTATMASAAAKITVYTDPSAFASAVPNLKTESFDEEAKNPAPLKYGPFTFEGARYYNDFVPDVGTYIASGGLVKVYRSYAAGFDLGSFYGANFAIPVYVNGKLLYTLDPIRRKEIAFVGFVSDKWIRTVDFRNTDELDFISLSAGAAVPEPKSWALMITGFGLIGSALRRGRRALSET